jgi:hypothetical protein
VASWDFRERSVFVRLAVLSFVLLFVAAGQTLAGDPSLGPPAATATAKERLSDKGSDEQRVNDCKVPLSRRTHTRPADCPWDLRS